MAPFDIPSAALDAALADFRIDSAEVAADYDEVVSYLLANCPAVHSGDGYTFLSRYQDVKTCALDPTFTTGQGTLRPRPANMVVQYPMEADPPLHTALRQALMPYFSPGAILAFEPLTRQVANELIDAFPDGGCEAVAAFCRPLPGLVIFRGLLGLPDDLVYPLSKALYEMFKGKPGGAERYQQGVNDALAYHAQHPTPHTLMSAVLELEIDGEPAPHDVQHSIVSSLILGGLETTTSVLSQAVYYLGTHPADRDRLVADPERMGDAVEEFLRLFAPAIALGRTATQTRTIAGHTFEPGDFVYLGWGPASRDPEVYDEPLRWDPHRDRKGKPHTAFGLGRHRCMGAPLGTLELMVALREFVRRLPNFTVEPGFEPRYSAAVNRTIAKVPITY